MHRTKYFKNPVMYYPRSEIDPPQYGYGPSLSQTTRSTYKRSSTTPFSPSIKRSNNIYATNHTTYTNPRQSKYVWTANKQQQPSQPTPNPAASLTPAPQPPTAARVPPTTPAAPSATQLTAPRVVAAVPHNGSISRRELSYLNVTALDTPNAVAVDIAAKLREDKFYVIKTVVDVLGVKKAIKLFYETREKELKGGMLIQNGKRRRTPGGVYLALLRETSFIPKQEADKVFLEIKRFESRINKNPHYMQF